MATSCGSVHTGRLHEHWPRSLLRTSLLAEGNREARSEPEEGSGWHNQLGLKGTMASVWLRSKTTVVRPPASDCRVSGQGVRPTDKPAVVYQSSHKRSPRRSCPISLNTQRPKQPFTSLSALTEPLSAKRNQITCCLKSDM